MSICDKCGRESECPVAHEDDFCLNYVRKPQTNADRIRAMSDEELADFIGGIFTLEHDLWGDYDPRTVVTQEPRVELRSREDVLDWLKQEATE